MENLKYLLYKGNLTTYQRALAQREFEGLIERLELFENYLKNAQPEVDGNENLEFDAITFLPIDDIQEIDVLIGEDSMYPISKSELPTLINWLKKQL